MVAMATSGLMKKDMSHQLFGGFSLHIIKVINFQSQREAVKTDSSGSDVIDILTRKDMENTPFMIFPDVVSYELSLQAVYFLLKHSCLYNKMEYFC